MKLSLLLCVVLSGCWASGSVNDGNYASRFDNNGKKKNKDARIQFDVMRPDTIKQDSSIRPDSIKTDFAIINDMRRFDSIRPDTYIKPDTYISPDTYVQLDSSIPDTMKPDTNTSICTVFPADNPWNTPIDTYPVHPNSANFITAIGATTGLHTDFGQGVNGIPYVVVSNSVPLVKINFTMYPTESDPGPYRVPFNAPIEVLPDAHVIAVDMDNCMLYEMWQGVPQPSLNRWDASCGAKYDMKSNALRPIGWTSADAAGLPIFPGLVRYDEVQAGVINHALRFTVAKTRKAYILPATHYASSSTNVNLPPMGLRFRLKASVDISGFSKTNQVILTALKKYGMIVADNGGTWFLSGAPNPNWDDEDLISMRDVIKGNDFEAVYTGPTKTTY